MVCRVRPSLPARVVGTFVALWLASYSSPAASFSVATYNVEGYLTNASDSRPEKPAAARTMVQRTLLHLAADVVALQEIGGTNALLELRSALQTQGLHYPHWDLAHGYDTNIQVAILSRFPIVARRSHEKEGFLLRGRRYQTTRGFEEIDLVAPPDYPFTLFNVHLKSRREVAGGNQEELREQEARLLRRLIDARLRAQPGLNLILLGDFNDLKSSLTLRTILGRGNTALVDTHPAERNGDDQPHPDPRYPPRRVVWTHYYAKEDTYSRVDYILLSPGMAREWNRAKSFVLALPNWGVASDHRPLLVTFDTPGR
jgi:endonuclease/exonuclease/phosphatase family metal-dependent hydrolase